MSGRQNLHSVGDPLPHPRHPALSSSRLAHSLLKGAGIGAGGTLLTGVPVGAGLDADTAAALTLAPPAAQQPVAGHAGVRARGTVAVVAGPVGVT